MKIALFPSSFVGAAILSVGCGTGETVPAMASVSAGATSSDASSSDASGASIPPGPGTSTSAESSDTRSPDDPPIFDVPVPDLPDGHRPTGSIPATCAEAENYPSSMGCEFFAVELENFATPAMDTFAVVAANVQTDANAVVVVQVYDGVQWSAVDSQMVAPLDAHVFTLNQTEVYASGVLEHAAFRVVSDVPVAAYQFNLYVPWASSDASLLLPTATWDTRYRIATWERQLVSSWDWPGYFTVVSAVDGAVVNVTATDPLAAGPGIPAIGAGQTTQVTVDTADYAQFAAAMPPLDPTGTLVDSGDVPVAVFGGSSCSVILDQGFFGACDHLEEQLPGVGLWGMTHVAARVPVRSPVSPPERSVWQIVASEDDTSISFEAGVDVTGVPGPLFLDAGEQARFMVGGTLDAPGDFVIEADRPVLVVNYSLSGDELHEVLDGMSPGDPAMIVMPPVEQYLPRYVLFVPEGWAADTLTIVRPAGVPTQLDGVLIDDAEFGAVGAGHEVARLLVDDGVHTLEADEGIAVTVVGYGDDDGYGYAGGIGTAVINPGPQG